MPRDGNGNYNPADQSSVQDGQTITTTWAESTIDDLSTALTTSLATDGQSTMTGKIRGFAGTVTEPGYTFSGDINSGLLLNAVGSIYMSIAGVQVMRWTAGLVEIFRGGAWVPVNNQFPGDDPDLVDNDAALVVGSSAPSVEQHIEIGPTTIQSKASTAVAADLNINPLGGNTLIGDSVTGFTSGGDNKAFIDANGMRVIRNSAESFRIQDGSFNTEFSIATDGFTANIDSVVEGAIVLQRAFKTGDTIVPYLYADPDNETRLYYSGSDTIRTMDRDAGGLQVDNNLTGVGYERVATVSDLGTVVIDPIAGYSGAIKHYLNDAGASTSSYPLSSSQPTENTYVIVGSGGWAALGDMPATATMAMVQFQMEMGLTANDGRRTMTVYARKPGDAVGTVNRAIALQWSLDAPLNSGIDGKHTTTVLIPCDGTQQIELAWTDEGANTSSITCYLRGFITT